MLVTTLGSNSTAYGDDPGLRYVPSTSTLTVGNISATGNVNGANIVIGAGNLYIGNTPFTRTLVVGTRTTPVTVPLTSNNTFDVLARTGNITVYTT